MSKNLYIGDMHIGHHNILSFDNRPFFTTQEMTDVLIKNWNENASENDNIYVLGDMFWKNHDAENILKQLNGNKYLILGNHDNPTKEMKKYFIWVKEYAEIVDNNRHVVLCHYPIPCFKNHFYDWYHLYAHVHTSFEHNMMLKIKSEMTALYNKPCHMYNVGCMLPYMNFTPRTLNEIIIGAGNVR